MKYKTLVIFILLVQSIILNGNNKSFTKYYNSPNDKAVFDLIEFDNFYLLTGRVKINGRINSAILKINKNGGLLNEFVLDSNSLIINSHKINNEIILISQFHETITNRNLINYKILDTNLNILTSKNTLLPDSIYISRLSSTFDNDSNLLLVGTSNYINSPPLNLNVLILKISPSGDSLDSKFIKTGAQETQCFDLLVNNNEILLFGSVLSYFLTDGFILKLDSMLNITDTIALGNDLYDYYSPIAISSSSIVILTKKSLANHQLYMSKIDFDGNILNSKKMPTISVSNPAYQNSLALSSNSLYFTYNLELSMANPFFGHGNSSQIIIGKVDTNLNILWKKSISFGYYQHVYNIIETKDGGCLTVGTYNDTLNHNYNRNIFLIKSDSNGVINWVNKHKVFSDIKIFPNPATDFINLELQSQTAKIESIKILNAQGKILLIKEVNSNKIKINISNLNSGVYFIEASTNTGERVVEKFVKQ